MAYLMGRRGIVILGKARGRRKESLQLMGRSGLAGLLWHLHPKPKLLILIVSRDAPEIPPDALRVARFLSEEMQIPASSVLARTWASCTLVEARAVRVLARAHSIVAFDVLTHPYHCARVQRLFEEVLTDVRVIPVEPAGVASLVAEGDLGLIKKQVATLVERSMPQGLDLLRERVAERVLRALHCLDPRGRVERLGAALIRPGAKHERAIEPQA